MPKGLKWHRFVQTPPTMTSDLLHCLDSTINNILVARLSKGYPPITQLNTAQLCGAEKATCLKFPVSHKRAELVSSSSCWHTCAHLHKHLEFISTWWVLACLEGSSRFFLNTILCSWDVPRLQCFLAVLWALLPTAPLDKPSGFVDSNS